MPFQLDTSLYGGIGSGGGASRQQQSPFGMLGDLMDLRMRQESLRGMQASRELADEQKRLAIDKANDARAEDDAVRGAFGKKPKPTFDDLIQAGVGPERATTIANGLDTHFRRVAGEQIQDQATEVRGVLGLAPDQQATAWNDVQAGWKVPPDQRVPWSPEVGQSYLNKSLTSEQFATAEEAKVRDKTAKDAEARLAAAAKIEEPGKIAEATAKVRAEFVPRLMAAPTLAQYTAQYNNIPEQYRSSVPPPAEWAQNPNGARARIQTLGLTPEQSAAQAARNADRAQVERHFNITNARLEKEGGITPAMKNSALVRLDNDRIELEREVSRRELDNPMTSADYLDRSYGLVENYNAQMGLPPDRQLAEERKAAALQALNEEYERLSQPKKNTQGVLVPGPGMADKVLDAKKLAIENRYRAAYGKPPLAKLPEGYTSYRPKAQSSASPSAMPPPVGAPPPQAGTLASLVNPQLPPPGMPAAPMPGANDPQAIAQQIAQVLRQPESPGKRELLLNLRARYGQLVPNRTTYA